jgi:hypothetical protein
MIRSSAALGVARAVLLVAGFLGGTASTAGGQIPGLPVLQNAWANSGFTAAVNAGGGDNAGAAALAAAWAPGGARFQLSAGVGTRRPSGGPAGATFGARVAVPAFSFANGRIGVAGFAGVGGSRHQIDGDPSNTTVNSLHVPLGVGIGYRHPFGAIRGMSAYLTPFYGYWRTEVGGESITGGVIRAAAGVDVGLSRNFGITAGVEGGQNRGAGRPGPGGVLFGGGVSYAFGRR